eukprot:359384-Chlamydomonas_euryale.AAC.8
MAAQVGGVARAVGGAVTRPWVRRDRRSRGIQYESGLVRHKSDVCGRIIVRVEALRLKGMSWECLLTHSTTASAMVPIIFALASLGASGVSVTCGARCRTCHSISGTRPAASGAAPWQELRQSDTERRRQWQRRRRRQT